MKRAVLLLPALLAASGCAPSPPTPVAVIALPSQEPLYAPERVVPGRLEYTPDGSTFAPILTERVSYPTQDQANDAFRRRLVDTVAVRAGASSVWLFGCKPGALDERTARIVRYRGPVVHCATDLLDPAGRRLDRQTINFAYDGAIWQMQPVDPPRTAVPWRGREGSPKDPWSWVPGRDRYE